MTRYNPFSEEVMRDPLPVYARLREEAPAYYIEEYDAWALSRFEDIWTCSMDAEHFSAVEGTTSSHLLTKVQPVTPMINMMDPPQHTALRSKIRIQVVNYRGDLDRAAAFSGDFALVGEAIAHLE